VRVSSDKSGGVLLPSSIAPATSTTVAAAVDTSLPPEATTVGLTTTTLKSFLQPGVAGTAPTTGAAGTRRLVADSAGVTEQQLPPFKLFVADRGTSHCVELDTKGKTYAGLLCGAASTKKPIGDLVVVDIGGQRAVVAVAAPTVTGLTTQVGQPSGSVTGLDPSRSGVSYVGAVLAAGSSGVNLLVQNGDNSVARIVVPDKAGAVAAAKVTQVDAKPYGTWPGYKKAGYTGLYWGGHQDIGFYDGAGGVRCVLYRRFGGDAERVLADACPAKSAGAPVPLAVLIPTKSGDPRWFHILAVADVPVDGYTCQVPSGASCGTGGSPDTPPSPVRAPDPTGSGRTAFGEFVTPVDPAGADHVTLVFQTGGHEVARLDVPVPA
jgi:hypothetical protein